LKLCTVEEFPAVRRAVAALLEDRLQPQLASQSFQPQRTLRLGLPPQVHVVRAAVQRGDKWTPDAVQRAVSACKPSVRSARLVFVDHSCSNAEQRRSSNNHNQNENQHGDDKSCCHLELYGTDIDVTALETQLACCTLRGDRVRILDNDANR